MQAGKLRKRITFLSPRTVRDQYGANVQQWDSVLTCWASISPLSGRQLALAQAGTVTATATHDIRVRFDARLRGQTTYRIAYDDPNFSNDGPRYFRINAILDTEERHRELRITATEVVS